MKRFWNGVLSVILCITLMPALPVSSEGMEGKDDSGVFKGSSWEFDSATKTLTLSGEGELSAGGGSYSRPDRPWWEDHLFEVQHIVVSEGITALGRGYFNFGYSCPAKDISLPSTLKTVGGAAFSNLSSVEEIVIPEGVTTIGGAAFSGCESLRRAIIPDSVTEIDGRGLFQGCSALTEVQLSNQLKSLPSNAFTGCTALQTIDLPDSIETIEKRCFTGCRALTLDKLPDNLKTIETLSFSDCHFADDFRLPPQLAEIEPASLPDEWVRARKWVLTDTGFLYSCWNPRSYYEYDAATGETKYLGGNDAFESNVVLPDTVKTIGAYAFTRGFEPTRSEDLPPVIESLTVPRSVTDIRPNAFARLEIPVMYGYSASFAQQYANGNGIRFEALDAERPAVKPAYGSRTLPIENAGRVLGTGYPMNEWHTLLLREWNGSNPLELKNADTGWEGSCFGLTALQILLDSGSLSPETLGAASIGEIAPTADNISFISCLQHTNRLPRMIAAYSDQSRNTQKQALAHIINCAQKVNAGASPYLVCIRTKTGLHAVAGYGLESGAWEWDGAAYDHRILLWDSNYIKGGEKPQLYYDSESMHWCIPAYGLGYAEVDSDTGALLYAIENTPALFSYFTERYAPIAGDITADAQLSISDAVLMSRYLAEDASPEKATGYYQADTNADGLLDADDLLYILRRVSA